MKCPTGYGFLSAASTWAIFINLNHRCTGITHTNFSLVMPLLSFCGYVHYLSDSYHTVITIYFQTLLIPQILSVLQYPLDFVVWYLRLYKIIKFPYFVSDVMVRPAVFQLTHLPLVPQICVSESGQHWFKYCLVAYSAPSHYLNPCWVIFNWTLGKKFQLNLNQNTKLSFMKMHLNVVSEMGAILSRESWVKPSSKYDDDNLTYEDSVRYVILLMLISLFS